MFAGSSATRQRRPLPSSPYLNEWASTRPCEPHESLLEYNLPIGGCLVNRITPEFDHEFLQKRRQQELERIAELDEKLGNVNVGQLELADGEIVGVAALREVGRTLYGEPETLPEAIGPHEVGGSPPRSAPWHGQRDGGGA